MWVRRYGFIRAPHSHLTKKHINNMSISIFKVNVIAIVVVCDTTATTLLPLYGHYLPLPAGGSGSKADDGYKAKVTRGVSGNMEWGA